MQFNLLTGLLALSAPLAALAAPTTASSSAPATTASANPQPTINNAWEIVSSLDSTLNFHEFSINFTLAFFPENPSDAQKVSVNSSVSVNIEAMNEAIKAAVVSVKEITRIEGKATAAEVKAVQQVSDALSALVYRSTGTVKTAAKKFNDADIVIVGGGVFSSFVAVFESFVFGVEDIFLSFVPGVQVFADSLVDVLETILVLL